MQKTKDQIMNKHHTYIFILSNIFHFLNLSILKSFFILLLTSLLTITSCISVFAEDVYRFENERSLPSSVDLTSYFPSPRSQGNLGSCVAWAVCYAAKSASESKKREWTVGTNNHNFSPSYVYNQLAEYDQNENEWSGLNLEEAVDYVVENGVCTLTYLPYEENVTTLTMTDEQNGNASLYIPLRKQKTSTLNQIKTMLNYGRGCIIAINVAPDFDNISLTNQIFDNKTNITSDGHAICLIGYDDSKNAFKFINSWGTDWGINGYGWISYTLVGDSDVNQYGANKSFCLYYDENDDYTMGDIDDDSTVSTEDSRLVLRYTIGLETLSAYQRVIADVDGDGSITTDDSRFILRFATGIIDQLPLYD